MRRASGCEHHFHRFGQVSAPQFAHWVAARTSTCARHRRDGAAVAQSGRSPKRRDHRSSLGRSAESALARAIATTSSRASASDEEAEERFENRSRDPQGVDSNEPSRIAQVLAVRQHRGRAADEAKAASADLDGGRPRTRSAGARRGAKLLSRRSCLDRADDRALQHLQAEVEALGKRVRSEDVGVCRAFYVAKDAARLQNQVRGAAPNQQRMSKLADPAGTGKSSMLCSTTRSMRRRTARVRHTRDIAKKLDTLQAAGCRAGASQRASRVADQPASFRPRVMPAFPERRGGGGSRDAALAIAFVFIALGGGGARRGPVSARLSRATR